MLRTPKERKYLMKHGAGTAGDIKPRQILTIAELENIIKLDLTENSVTIGVGNNRVSNEVGIVDVVNTQTDFGDYIITENAGVFNFAMDTNFLGITGNLLSNGAVAENWELWYIGSVIYFKSTTLNKYFSGFQLGENVLIDSDDIIQGVNLTEDYLLISTPEEFNNIRNDTGGKFRLVNNIDLVPTYSNWVPIGNTGVWFGGVLDGKNFNVNVESDRLLEEDVSLFTTNWGLIGNLTISGSVVGGDTASGLSAGNSGLIFNCHSSVEVEGTKFAGGLIGVNVKDVLNSSASGNVIGGLDGFAGGFVGENSGTGNTNNCFASGNVSGHLIFVGGFVGNNIDNTVKNCYASGDVTNTGNHTGGFAGNALTPLDNCFASGNVIGVQNVGGFMGIHNTNVNGVYGTGDVTGETINIGGLTGATNSGGAAGTNHWRYILQNIINEDNPAGTEATVLQLQDRLWHENILGSEFDCSPVDSGFYPKLYKQGTTELLPNQPNVPLRLS